MKRSGRIRRLCLAVSCLACGAAVAAPVSFRLILDVTDAAQGPFPDCSRSSSFGCGNAPGDRHIGSFTVDSALLEVPGMKSAGVSDFLLRIGGVVWDQSNPSPASDFAGFIDATGAFSRPSFDIIVADGTIGGLRGGVHGVSDPPSIDFNVRPGGFEAIDRVSGATGIGGTLRIARIPEPATLALVAAALVATVLRRLPRRDGGAGARRR